MIIQGIRYASDFEAKKMMIEIGQSLDEKGYTLAQDGSMSVRVGPNMVWITTQDSENGALSQGDFVRVDLNGKSMNHSPDAVLPEDLEVHLKIYRENPKIQGIIHAYPVCAVVLQKDGRGLEPCCFTPSVRSLGKVTLIPSGDRVRMGAAAALAAKSDKGVLLENDGCLMWGACVREAYRNIRLLDYCAQVRSRMGDCRDALQPGERQTAGSFGAVPEALPGSGSPEQTVSGRIPGLTGLYHPSGGSLPVPENSASSRRMPVRTGQSDPSRIPGLTGLYHPSGESLSVADKTGESRSLAGGTAPDQAEETVRSAAPDPVKDLAMAEVIRKSMSKMGKGGL